MPAEAMTITDKRIGWHWTDYWRTGRAEVLSVQTSEGPVALDTAEIWRGFFADFPAGSRLIDLATGSGQVARHAVAAGTGKSPPLEVVGVDYASLDSGVSADPGLTLMGEVSLEALPFPAAHFDGASSQFGIEYADARRALPELSRVLKPGGKCRMLLHHAGSVITGQTAAQIAAYDGVLGGGAAIRQARRAFGAHLKGAPPATLRQAEAAFADAVRKTAARLRPEPAFDQPRYLVGYLVDLCERIDRYDPANALKRLDEFEAGNAAWRQRQHCQVRAALDQGGLEALVHRAGRVGLTAIEQGEAHDSRGALIGWTVAFSRA